MRRYDTTKYVDSHVCRFKINLNSYAYIRLFLILELNQMFFLASFASLRRV